MGFIATLSNLLEWWRSLKVSTKGPSAEKILHLESATNNLTRSVERLTDVVGKNNSEVNLLREQVNNKADRSDIVTPAEVAKNNREAVRRGIAAAIISSAVAGSISYYAAEQQVKERTRAAFIACERNNNRAAIDAGVFTDISAVIPAGVIKTRLQTAVRDLRALQADCEKLHPGGDRD